MYAQMIFNKGAKSIQWRKNSLFNSFFLFSLRKLDIHIQKKNLDPYLQAQSKNELKMDQRPKQRYKTIELLQETKGESFMLLVLAMISYI